MTVQQLQNALENDRC